MNDTSKFNEALNHGLVLKKLHIVIKFKSTSWLKSYNNINTDLRKKARTDFEKESKILLYEFWYDYVNPKYGEKPK